MRLRGDDLTQIVGFACTTTGLWIEDNGLGFTGDQSFCPST